ncbi:MAG TPA: hypothetical protein VNW04_17120 [Puia sp.]|nr:hypothetical protein [Puia sp.]
MLANEHEGTRNLLRKSVPAPTPAGLEDRVMFGIAAEMDKRAKSRAALSGLLKCVAIGLMAIAVAQSFFPGGTAKTLVAEAGKVTEEPSLKIMWLLHNTYFLAPLLGLYVFSKIYRLKAGE